MKITKRQLRRLIREEKAKLLAERTVPQTLIENLNAALEAVWQSAESDGDAEEVIREEVDGFLQGITKRFRY
jgi:hypothetical protein